MLSPLLLRLPQFAAAAGGSCPTTIGGSEHLTKTKLEDCFPPHNLHNPSYFLAVQYRRYLWALSPLLFILQGHRRGAVSTAALTAGLPSSSTL